MVAGRGAVDKLGDKVIVHMQARQWRSEGVSESCGKCAHYGYNCPPKVPVIFNPEPCQNQTIKELPQTLLNVHPTCYSGVEDSFTYDSNHNFVDDSSNPPPQPPTYTYEFCGNNAYYDHDCPPQIPICYDGDDDEERSIPLKDTIISGLPPCVAITPNLPKTNSLIIEDKHLSTISETESDEFIKSSVENLVPTPSESEDECECDMPDCDDSQTTNFLTYSNPLFDDSTSSNDESSHEEEIHEMSFITYSNPLFDLGEEIISSEFNPIHNEDPDSTPKNDRFDTESYLLESLVNHDTLTVSPPKIDFLFDEFAGELTQLQSIPPGIDNINLDPEGAILEEIDIFFGPDDSIPPGIESDDFDSEDDDNSTSLPEFESFHVDYPDSGDSTIDVVEDIPIDVPNILPTHLALQLDFNFILSLNDLGSDLDVSSPSGDRNKIYDPGICIEVESTRILTTLPPVTDTLLTFSSENEDKVFNHGVLASKKKSSSSLSLRALKASKLFHQKSPMLIHGDNTPNLGETDIRQKDEKSSKNGQNRARNGKAWKSQSQIKAKVKESQSQRSKPYLKDPRYVYSAITNSGPVGVLQLQRPKLSPPRNQKPTLHLIIIMAQRQQAADVHPDDPCPPNKRYDFMDANKKVDLENKFRTIFHLPQANDNNHASFVPPPSFSDMVPFYKQVLGFTMELKTVSNFKIHGLLQPWQTLCKIFSKCLTTQLMWEGIYYSLHHPATSIPYPRFTKIIISHYMTIFPEISRRARDAYHNLQDDDIMKNIFNSGRNKNKVGMRIPAWMITEEMKLTEHYKMYAEVFGLDVPLTQSQPTESTQGTHRTTSAPRSPNPATEPAESSVPKRSTVIRFRLPSRQSARLTPPVPVPTAEKADEMILQDMIQHLAAEEIEKLVEDPENVDDSSPPRHDDTSILGTRLEPRSDKESLEVEIVQEKEEEITKDTKVEPDKDTPMVDITNIVPPINVDDEEDEITDEVFELRIRVKGKNVEETRISPIPSPTRSARNLSTLVSSDIEKFQELTVTHPTPSLGLSEPKFTKTNHLLSLIKAKPNRFKSYKSFFHELQGRYGYLFAHLKKRFMPRTSSDQLADNLHDVMIETLPSLVKEKVTEQVKKEVPAQVQDQVFVYLAEGLILERKTTKEETERLISKAILQERGRMQAQISSQIQNAFDNDIPSLVDASADPLLQQQDIAIWLALQMKFEKSQKTSEYEAYVSGESSSRQVNVEEPGPSTSGNQEQDDEFDFWTDSYASDDDEIPTKQVTQDIMEEISLTIDEAKLKKMADEMLRQRCTSGDEHQDPEAPALSLINQDLLYLKKGNSGPEKIVLSLHKFPAIVFNDDDIEERTSRWVNKCIKKFNPYARYGVENWKNPHAKIFYIRRHKEPGRQKEEIYSNF
ncbi:hypothetical protein Tco_0162732 [Tanacetum coccineum]